MKMSKKFIIILFIMAFILTFAISAQINTVRNYNTVVTGNYEQNNLRAQVLKYKEKYDAIIKETESVDNELKKEIEKATNNNSELEQENNEITDGNKMIGLSEVTGTGVKITIADSTLEASKSLNPSNLLVHDIDILSVVNELKNAGAEAISINGQRVVLTTFIMCGGNIININGEKIGSPFVINAIGSPEALANLNRPGGTLETLKERKLRVSLEKSNNITIPKYSGVLNFKYLTNKD